MNYSNTPCEQKLKVSDIPSLKKIVPNFTHHEAGHCIIAKKLGFKTEGLTLLLEDTYGAHIGKAMIKLFEPCSTIDELIDYLNRRIIVLFSGVIAENIIDGKIDNAQAIESLQKNGVNDYAKASELIHILNNLTLVNPKNTQDNLWRESIDLVEQNYNVITDVAKSFADEILETQTEYTFDEDTIQSIVNHYEI